MNIAAPVPRKALDDRLGFVGTSGSGKTYGAGVLVEVLLANERRTIIIDPLGVWYGLRADPSGKQSSAFKVVIFGGPHGDLPITPLSGALIGETVAGMAESCILDLSQLGTKAAERRFMLAFLEMLYRNVSGEPVHLVVDEADMWAPQKLMDKEGEAPKLLGMMETIVRRGRVKGFIPWLITQRPAVLSKDVLSQADGLVIFKLTSSQDRDAVGAWVEGQADKGQWTQIYGELAGKERGHAVVWLPGHGILTGDAPFPEKATFDSSATPKRGQKKRSAALKPLDVGALKEKLATVEAETKANDPKALKNEIATLRRQMSEAARIASATGTAIDPKAIEVAERRGDTAGHARGYAEGVAAGFTEATKLFDAAIEALHVVQRTADDRIGALAAAARVKPAPMPARAKSTITPAPRPSIEPRPAPRLQPIGDPTIDGPQRRLLTALAWWKRMGHDKPSRAQVAGIAGWKITSGHLKNVVGSLKTAGLVDYPDAGRVALTSAGAAAAPEPDMSVSLHDGIRSALDGPQIKIFDTLVDRGELDRTEIAAACGWEPTSGHLKNVIGSLRTLEIVAYPSGGRVALQDWVTG